MGICVACNCGGPAPNPIYLQPRRLGQQQHQPSPLAVAHRRQHLLPLPLLQAEQQRDARSRLQAVQQAQGSERAGASWTAAASAAAAKARQRLPGASAACLCSTATQPAELPGWGSAPRICSLHWPLAAGRRACKHRCHCCVCTCLLPPGSLPLPRLHHRPGCSLQSRHLLPQGIWAPCIDASTAAT